MRHCMLIAVLLTAQDRSPETEALAALDRFMAAFNARDMDAWRRTLHYPHVRIAGGSVRVATTAADYGKGFSFEQFASQTGWHHSAWTKREVVQTSADKVHVAVTFARYRADNRVIGTYPSLYIVTRKEGAWGVQARSSFAP